MLPAYDEHGNLLPGVWVATIQEIRERFAQAPHRQQLFKGLLEVIAILQQANCPEVYLDGSFITTVSEPGDYDLCYEPTGMMPTQSWKRLLKMTMKERKKKYLGDIFVHMPQPPFFTNYIEYWQTDRENRAKGIICIKLRQQDNDKE